jgi:hypothetical protein
MTKSGILFIYSRIYLAFVRVSRFGASIPALARLSVDSTFGCTYRGVFRR